MPYLSDSRGYVSKFKLAERTAPTGSQTRRQARRVTMMMTSRPVIVCSPLFSTSSHHLPAGHSACPAFSPSSVLRLFSLLPIGLSSVLRLFLALLTVLSVQRTSMPNAHLLISGYLRRSVEIYSLHPDSIIHHIHRLWRSDAGRHPQRHPQRRASLDPLTKGTIRYGISMWCLYTHTM